MRYIQRNNKGEVVGHYANEHSYATECVHDDHPDILAWRARSAYRQAPSTSIRVDAVLRRSPFARGVMRLIAEHFGMSEKDAIQAIKDAAGEQVDGPRDATDKLFEAERAAERRAEKDH